MKKYILFAVVIFLLAFVGESLFLAMKKTTPEEPVACTMEAKLCPDGSAVGRTSPSCEFAPCPTTGRVASTTSSPPSSSQVFTQNGVSITPIAIEEDSRCPVDVQCIWTGRLRLRVRITDQTEIKETILTLGEPVLFGNTQVTLTTATPIPRVQKTLILGDYHFGFTVTKK